MNIFPAFDGSQDWLRSDIGEAVRLSKEKESASCVALHFHPNTAHDFCLLSCLGAVWSDMLLT